MSCAFKRVQTKKRLSLAMLASQLLIMTVPCVAKSQSHIDVSLRAGWPQAQWPVGDEQAALRCAEGFLGWFLAVKGTASARIVDADSRSYTANSVKAGRPIWRVNYTGAEVLLPVRDSAEPQRRLRDIEVLLHPSGQILRASVTDALSKRTSVPEPSQASYAAQLHHSGEMWTSLDNTRPASRDLVRALLAVKGANGPTDDAKVIIIQTPTWCFGEPKDPRREVRPVWSIDLRGIDPLPPPPKPGTPENAVNHARFIIDAATNKWLLTTTVPQPDPKDLAAKREQDVPEPAKPEETASPEPSKPEHPALPPS